MFNGTDGIFKIYMYYAAMSLELLGVAVICTGVLVTTCLFLYSSFTHREITRFYEKYRRGMGRAILLGLELLVAGDIIMTTTHGFEIKHLLVLGLLVLIRTFLSFALEIEINGHLPWKRPAEDDLK
jgi:uncharacterized membrane protein